MNASKTLLEEKYRRAMNFGTYLDQHPTLSNDVLGVELSRATAVYRMAIYNVLNDMQPKAPKKRAKK